MAASDPHPPQPQVMKMSEDLTPDLARMREPFEAHPALASWVERLASTNTSLPLGDWMVFIGSLNAAILAERAAQSPFLDRIAELEGERTADAIRRRKEADAHLAEVAAAKDERDIANGKWIAAEAQVSALQAELVEAQRTATSYGREADEAERRVLALQAQVDGLREALRPFGIKTVDFQGQLRFVGPAPSRADFARARSLLSQPPADEAAKGEGA